jgi:hypothetical protein
MPQNGVMEIPNDDESVKFDKFSLRSLWKQSWHDYKCFHEQLKSKSSTGTGMAWNPRHDWATGC